MKLNCVFSVPEFIIFFFFTKFQCWVAMLFVNVLELYRIFEIGKNRSFESNQPCFLYSRTMKLDSTILFGNIADCRVQQRMGNSRQNYAAILVSMKRLYLVYEWEQKKNVQQTQITNSPMPTNDSFLIPPILTVNNEHYTFANRWRNSIRRNAQISSHIESIDTRNSERGSIETAH